MQGKPYRVLKNKSTPMIMVIRNLLSNCILILGGVLETW